MTEIERLPGHLARRFQQVAVAIFSEEAKAVGLDLTPVQYAALVTVRDHAMIDQASLAGRIAYDRTTIGGVVDRLTRKGLLSRQAKEGDRRAHALCLTGEGEAALARIGPAVQAAQRRMLEGLTPEEEAQLLRLLEKVTLDRAARAANGP